MTDELPRSTHSGTVTIMGVELICHRLDNGQAIFEAEGFERLLAAMFSGEHEMTEEDAAAIARVIHGRHT